MALSAKIISHSIRLEATGVPFLVFCIRIVYAGKRKVISRRTRQFHELHAQLIKEFPGLSSSAYMSSPHLHDSSVIPWQVAIRNAQEKRFDLDRFLFSVSKGLPLNTSKSWRAWADDPDLEAVGYPLHQYTKSGRVSARIGSDWKHKVIAIKDHILYLFNCEAAKNASPKNWVLENPEMVINVRGAKVTSKHAKKTISITSSSKHFKSETLVVKTRSASEFETWKQLISRMVKRRITLTTVPIKRRKKSHTRSKSHKTEVGQSSSIPVIALAMRSNVVPELLQRQRKTLQKSRTHKTLNIPKRVYAARSIKSEIDSSLRQYIRDMVQQINDNAQAVSAMRDRKLNSTDVSPPPKIKPKSKAAKRIKSKPHDGAGRSDSPPKRSRAPTPLRRSSSAPRSPRSSSGAKLVHQKRSLQLKRRNISLRQSSPTRKRELQPPEALKSIAEEILDCSLRDLTEERCQEIQSKILSINEKSHRYSRRASQLIFIFSKYVRKVEYLNRQDKVKGKEGVTRKHIMPKITPKTKVKEITKLPKRRDHLKKITTTSRRDLAKVRTLSLPKLGEEYRARVRAASRSSASSSSDVSEDEEKDVCRICEQRIALSKLEEHSAVCAALETCDVKNATCDVRLENIIDALRRAQKNAEKTSGMNKHDTSNTIAELRVLEAVAKDTSRLSFKDTWTGIDTLHMHEDKVKNLVRSKWPGHFRDPSIVSIANKLLVVVKDKRESLLEYQRLMLSSPRKHVGGVWNFVSFFEKPPRPPPKRRKFSVSIQDFTIIKPISRGAYGRVYLARKNSTGDTYAIKMLDKESIMQRKNMEYVLAERNAMVQAQNEWVIQLFYAFQSEKYIYLVMEYMVGGDLANLLRQFNQFEEEMACVYSAEILLALEFIHSIGIVHRDLKPDNLLINTEGHLQLTDFGLSDVSVETDESLNRMPDPLLELAKQTAGDSKKDSPDMKGTPHYLSPEILLGKPHGKEVDFWALGIIIYEFICGLPPFDGDSAEAIFNKIINNEKQPWPDDVEVSEEAKDLVAKLLEPDPSKRLGKNGTKEIKDHPFFASIDWKNLPSRDMSKFFVPKPDDDEDTSYHWDRSEHYGKMDDNPVAPAVDRAQSANRRMSRLRSASIEVPHFDYTSFRGLKRVTQQVATRRRHSIGGGSCPTINLDNGGGSKLTNSSPVRLDV